MFDLLNRRMRRLRETGEDGFTLIELLVVVVIIGILIAIAIPLYLNYQKNAADKAAQSDLRGAVSVLEQCNADTGNYPSGVSQDATTGALTITATPACSGKINLSKNTKFKYVQNPNASTGTYMIADNNTGGSKYYCYNSGNGGAVSSITSADLASATC